MMKFEYRSPGDSLGRGSFSIGTGGYPFEALNWDKSRCIVLRGTEYLSIEQAKALRSALDTAILCAEKNQELIASKPSEETV